MLTFLFLYCIFTVYTCIYYLYLQIIDTLWFAKLNYPSSTANPAFLSNVSFKLYKTSHKHMIWNYSGMVLHTYLSIQVFSNKARLGTKKQKNATKNLLNEKKCTLKNKKHPRITPSFSNLFASILFLPFHFTPDVQRAMMTMMSMSSSIRSRWIAHPSVRYMSALPKDFSVGYLVGPAGGYLVDPLRMAMAVDGWTRFWVPWGGWSLSGQKRAVLRGAGWFDRVSNFGSKKKPGDWCRFLSKKVVKIYQASMELEVVWRIWELCFCQCLEVFHYLETFWSETTTTAA